ncbi:hypothetical protein Tdes44962_MAKER03764 [Teratosphaeria destructans]|uniref:Uncharacterized protein n=1 Tax=Teratosphaeria destructans TaxID=418781 RepID=A0A9W7SP01_9PEZI|nr:hypothetical protein Tdes44962_MAKER03764 [Teratosphaeria destructans]
MGNKNFRKPAAVASKPANSAMAKSPTASPSTQTTQSPSAFRMFIKVNVCSHDSRVIKPGVDITALRRYSKEARLQIPPNSTTVDPSKIAAEFKLPQYIGYSMVTDEAVHDVVQFLEKHRRDNDLPRLTKESLSSEDLVHLINAYALVRALGVPFSPFPLEKQICEMIRKRPITASELAACWELLEDLHERIITTAVQSLTYFYRARKIDSEQAKAIEQYCSHETELQGLFGAEMLRQQRLSRERNRKTRDKKTQELLTGREDDEMAG